MFHTKIHLLFSIVTSATTITVNFCRRLLKDSFEEMAAFRRALKSLIAAANTDYSKKHLEFFVGLEGSFGSKHVTPRSLTSNHLGNIVCLEGIVTKCK